MSALLGKSETSFDLTDTLLSILWHIYKIFFSAKLELYYASSKNYMYNVKNSFT